ncbi:MAG: mucoidy inhibitor MuiA family protein [Deltaproteobacteria bacterium]|nr:mucoidy inhibitor MuiA family protein [Deltaproteobacteria bacterium]
MLWTSLFALSLLPSGVPAVTAGPDLAERAIVLDAPIAEVTVFSDRARVRRRAKIELAAGATAVRWPDLPGATLVDTVRVSGGKGTVLHVEAAPIDRERVSIDQADQALDRIETLTDQIAILDAERAVLSLELGLLTALQPAPPVPEAQREGRPLPPLEPEIFRRAIEFLAQSQARARARQRAIEIERREKLAALAEAQRGVQQLDLGGFTDRRIQVLVLIGSDTRASSELELEYFVPGARWRPSYDLRFFPDQAKVRVETVGVVEQASGEDWSGVELALSTAIPGQSIALPELLTWTLGEAKEIIPTPRARTAPPAIALNPPPQASATTAELERAARHALLAQRLTRLGQIAQADADTLVYQKQQVVSFAKDEIEGDLERGAGGAMAQSGKKSEALRPAKSMPPPAERPMQAVMAPASPSAGYRTLAEPSASYDEETVATGESRESSRSTAQRTSLALFEAPPPPRITFDDPTLPAVIAGGLDYVYRSPSRMSIPSTGAQVRAPLATDSYPVTTYYEATPALAENAFLKATVENKSRRPILQGPISIFVNNAFAGDATMKTTGPGGKIELPLGADEDIRFMRKVITKTEREGVFSKSDVTSYQVVIEVGNYKARAIRVGVTEVIPKASHEKIQIEVLKLDPKPSAGPDGEGIFRWNVDVPAGKTKTLTLIYQVERPADWQLIQP